ncbi:hypothetical protein ACWDOR_16235 [Streptosporangium canum]
MRALLVGFSRGVILGLADAVPGECFAAVPWPPGHARTALSTAIRHNRT